jgi:O-antigen ligase
MNDHLSERSHLAEAAKGAFFRRLLKLLLGAMVVISAFAYGAVDSWALALLFSMATLVALCWAFGALRGGAFQLNFHLLAWPVVGLLLIGLIQLLPLRNVDVSNIISVPPAQSLSLDPGATGFAVLHLILYLVFFLALLTFIDSRISYRNFVVAIISLGAALALFGIFQKLLNPESIYGTRPTPHAIPFGPFINSHHFAACMNMTLAVTLGAILGKGMRRELRIMAVFAAALMGIGIVMTGSRGGLLSLIGVLGFLVFFFFQGRRKNSSSFTFSSAGIAVGGIALVLLIGGGAVFLGGENSLLRGIGLGDHAGDISSGRTHFWQTALLIIRDYPIIGAGLDAFGVAFTKYDTWNGSFRIEQAHNDYLQILADAGVLGFVCVAAFIFLLFKKGLMNVSTISNAPTGLHRGAAIGALAGCFGILIHSFFDFPLRTPSNMLLFLTLAALATVKIGKT